MNYVAYIAVFFAFLGAIDRIIGNKFGLGKEFEKGIILLGELTLSMAGMIIISPYIAELIRPALSFLPDFIDPSVIPSFIFSIDMGGAPLARELSKNMLLGDFNGLVVSSMMGCTISFTIPFVLSVAKKEQHNDILFGLLCGIITIPIGCIAGGIIAKIPFVTLVLNLLPLILFSAALSFGLIKFTDKCIKLFNGIGILMKILITIGLFVGILEFLTGIRLIKNADTLENSMKIILSAGCVLAGAFPFLKVLSFALKKPLKKISRLFKINESSSMGLVATLASNISTFKDLDNMDKRGIVINSAFSVSASFVFADHLAFTLAYNEAFLLPMVIAKIISGIFSVICAVLLLRSK